MTIENSVAYSNGFLTTDDPTDPTVEFGEGNGFKLGGENMYGGHKLMNCISFNNYAKGITSNSCPDCEVQLCTAYNNSLNGSAYNVSLYTRNSNKKAWVVSGMLSIAENGLTTGELGASNGVMYSLKSDDNFFFDGAASYNNKGIKASSAWFVNTDVSVEPTRNADGTIDMHGLLELNSDAPQSAGASLVTKGKAISEQPVATTVVSVTPSADTKPAAGASASANAAQSGGTNSGAIVGAVAGVGIVAVIAGVLISRSKKKEEQ